MQHVVKNAKEFSGENAEEETKALTFNQPLRCGLLLLLVFILS